MYLFIDTTKAITLGLLDEQFCWKNYQFFENAKSSALIHKYINEQLEVENSSIERLKGLIQVAGPGSYTGMRVSEGISQIFSWQDFETYSFYHYEVPQLLGEEKGIWFSNAFKGEYFLYEWDKKINSSSLIKKDEFDWDKEVSYYSGFELEDGQKNILLTSTMIKDKANILFKGIVEQNIKKPLYYYRTIEEEYVRK